MAFRIERRGHVIAGPAEWLEFAGPKGGADQWKDGRSAKETAHAWCGADGPCVPGEILALLHTRPELRGIEITRAFPEHRIRFDNLAGEPRNADLALEATVGGRPVAITVEAKADESFGETVRGARTAAARRLATNPRSRGVDRIERLTAALLSAGKEGLTLDDDLRYQLLTAVAGTLAWARDLRASLAVLVVHEFVTDQTRESAHRTNLSDLTAFVGRMSLGTVVEVKAGRLYGPFRAPGSEHLPAVDLLIGKAVRVLRTSR